jgi:hypothetical protein
MDGALDEKPPLFGVGPGARSATGLGSGVARVSISNEGDVGKGKKKEEKKERDKAKELPKAKDQSVSFHPHTQIQDEGIPDELRGMGLGMPPPVTNGHDGMTSGMGFGDPFWGGTFGHPTSASGSGNSIIDHSTSDPTVPRVKVLILRWLIQSITHDSRHVTFRIVFSQSKRSIPNGRIRYRSIRFRHFFPNAPSPGCKSPRRFVL